MGAVLKNLEWVRKSLWVGLCLWSAPVAHASGQTPPVHHDKNYAFDYQGHELHFRIDRRVTQYGALEDDVYFLRDGIFFQDDELVLYGLDLDGDQYPETWFVRKDVFITDVIRLKPTDENQMHSIFNQEGEDSIQYLVKNVLNLGHTNIFNRTLVDAHELFLGTGNLLRHLGFDTVATASIAREAYARNEVDLLTLQLKIDELLAARHVGEKGSDQVVYLQALVSHGRIENLKKLNRAFSWGYSINAVKDVGLYFVYAYGGKVLSWAGKEIIALPRVAPIAESVSTWYQGVRSAVSVNASRVATRLGWKSAQKEVESSAVKASIFSLSRLEYQATLQGVRTQLKSFAARTQVAKRAALTLKRVGGIYNRGFLEQFRYVGLTQGLQVAAEAQDRWEQIKDPNFLVTVRNLFTNKEFLQDFGFMTQETVMQTGIHFSNEGSALSHFIVAGVVSFTDSGIMNIAVKGNVDRNRAIMDTGWEMTVGNFQTFTDSKMIQYAGEIEQWSRGRMPGFKVVGYVLAAVDQYAGYLYYQRVGQSGKAWLDKHAPIEVQKAAAGPDGKTSPLELVMIPLIAKDSSGHGSK